MALKNGPRVGGPKDFWHIIKSVSIAEIAREANRPLSVALVGPQNKREEALRALFTEDAQEAAAEHVRIRALPESPFVQGFDGLTEVDGFPQVSGIFDLVIDLGADRTETPPGLLIYSLHEIGGWDKTLERVLEDRTDLSLALARNFPVFRRRVANRIITQTATANAQFALLTGATAAFPLLGALLPVNALSDIVILTKNQAMMTLRLAAAYGLSLEYKSRLKEIGPILGNAFGWRAVAREIVGVLPFGFVAKAMIAYAGTASIGKAAQFYYETGETVTSAQAKRLYVEAYEASRERVRALADGLKRTGRPRLESHSDAPPALLEPARETDGEPVFIESAETAHE